MSFCAWRGVLIQRAFDGQPAALQNVGVDHGSFHILVAEQFLDGADTCPEPQVLGVVAVLEQVGGKAMAKSMRGNRFIDFGNAGSLAHGTLEDSFIDMVAEFTCRARGDGGARIAGALGCREDVLPGPFLGGARVFAVERKRQRNAAVAIFDILFVHNFYFAKVLPDGSNQRIGEHGVAVFVAFASPHDNLVVFKVNIFDAQVHTLHETQPSAIEDLCHEFGCSLHVADDGESFLFGEDGWEAGGSFGANQLGRQGKFAVKNVAVEEKHCAEGLVLGG